MNYKMLLAPLAIMAAPALAADYGIVINDGTQVVNVPGVGNVTFENKPGEANGGGYTAVTNNAPRGAAGTAGSNGSLELAGNKSRYAIGNMYEFASPGNPSAALIPLSQISSFSFEWALGTAATGGWAHQAPAGRIHVMDNGIRSEIVWEAVYNGGASGVAPATGVWNTASSGDQLWLNVRDNDGAAFLAQNAGLGLSIENAQSGQGAVYQNGGHLWDDFDALRSFYSSNAYVTGFSFGMGSPAPGGVGYVDNLRLTVGNDTAIVNFETAVPEPATWAMMLLGFGAVGFAARRRRAFAAA